MAHGFNCEKCNGAKIMGWGGSGEEAFTVAPGQKNQLEGSQEVVVKGSSMVIYSPTEDLRE